MSLYLYKNVYYIYWRNLRDLLTCSSTCRNHNIQYHKYTDVRNQAPRPLQQNAAHHCRYTYLLGQPQTRDTFHGRVHSRQGSSLSWMAYSFLGKCPCHTMDTLVSNLCMEVALTHHKLLYLKEKKNDTITSKPNQHATLLHKNYITVDAFWCA